MSARKPMGCYWAILAVRDDLLSGGRRILLAKMFLLDNGSRGCTASAALLGQYTGLTERTVDKYRRELEARGLLFPVTGTRGWHLNLPTGLPPDRATDAEIQAYARRIGEHIGAPEATPSGVANHTSGGGDMDSERPPTGEDLVASIARLDPAGLVSTQETRETALVSALIRSGNRTREDEQANSDGGLTDARILEVKRAWHDAAAQEAKLRGTPPAVPETAA